MTIRVSVLEFAVLAERFVRSLRLSRDLGDLSLVQAKNSELLGLSGSIGDVAYQFHGRGCAFSLSTGEEVDVDLDGEDRPLFDRWRLLGFFASRSELCSDDVLDAELGSLVAGGVLVFSENWYSLARRG
jgi:hypothetical protein